MNDVSLAETVTAPTSFPLLPSVEPSISALVCASIAFSATAAPPAIATPKPPPTEIARAAATPTDWMEAFSTAMTWICAAPGGPTT